MGNSRYFTRFWVRSPIAKSDNRYNRCKCRANMDLNPSDESCRAGQVIPVLTKRPHGAKFLGPAFSASAAFAVACAS